MSILAGPIPATTEEPEEEPEVVVDRFWRCPRCPYRIAYDFPGDVEEATAAHRNAHRLIDLGHTELATPGLLRLPLRR